MQNTKSIKFYANTKIRTNSNNFEQQSTQRKNVIEIKKNNPLVHRKCLQSESTTPTTVKRWLKHQIYDTKCLHYIDWLVETRPSFSPPRRDLRPPGEDPGANEVYTERLDTLNTKFQRLLEQLAQRLKTAIEVSGAEGLVSFCFQFLKLKCVLFFLLNEVHSIALLKLRLICYQCNLK